MAKPILVTLPFVMLLLDYWPLGRISNWKPLVLEKTPFLILVVLSCLVTLWAQHHGGAISSIEGLPLANRVANAALSYWRYLGKLLWPSHLAVFYPYGRPELNALTLLAVAGLAIATFLVIRARRLPYLAVGWLWFVGMLFPVIGLVQAGSQAMADRYSYLPSIGFFVIAVWGIADFVARFRTSRILAAATSAVVLLACLAATAAQLGYWRNSQSLYLHAIRVTDGNYVAWNNLGTDFESRGQPDDAIGCYRSALRCKPDHAEANDNLAQALMNKGKLDEARPFFERALKSNPHSATAHYNYANFLQREGNTPDAIAAFRQALALNVDMPQAHNNLACLLMTRGQLDEAIAHFQQALAHRPDQADWLNNLGVALVERGRAADALAPLRKSITLKSTNAEAHYNFGNAYAALKQRNQAVAEYQTALALNTNLSLAHYRLANLLLADGNAPAAEQHYRSALAGNPNHAESHYQLATMLLSRGEAADAIDQYREAIRLKPDWVEPLNNLAWVLAAHSEARVRNGEQAVQLATRAVALTHTNDPGALDTLAGAYAETGQFDDALATARKAMELAEASKSTPLLDEIRRHLHLYEQKQPAREFGERKAQ